MYKKIILICGMPRSGTSWLGQIFDSSPDVAFRMEPLFSYQFKNTINEQSSKEKITEFFSNVYLTNDDFIHQRENRIKGSYCSFKKKLTPDFLVVKTTRHHNLLEKYLNSIDCIEIISIIRHPCAVINSWINTDREFKSKGCAIEKDWKNGKCRKNGYGEFWGFDDWLSVTQQHVALSEKFPNFIVVEYSNLIQDPEDRINKLFKQLSIPYTKQTVDFLKDCHSNHHNDPYSVFKNKGVENSWKTTLSSEIVEKIVRKTKNFGIEQFIK